MSVLIVGSIAIDTVKTPVEEHSELLGGSASYAALAASFFSPVRLVGIVGNDFPKSEFDFWRSRKIDTEGVQRVNGKTFRWSGEYSWDLNTRETRSIDLNVFKDFKPELPESYRRTEFAWGSRTSRRHCKPTCSIKWKRPRFVVADTMASSGSKRPGRDLDKLLPRADLLNPQRQRSARNDEGNQSGRKRVAKFASTGSAIMSRSRRESTGGCSFAMTIVFLAAGLIRWKISTIRPG